MYYKSSMAFTHHVRDDVVETHGAADGQDDRFVVVVDEEDEARCHRRYAVVGWRHLRLNRHRSQGNFMSQKFRVKFHMAEFLRTLIETFPHPYFSLVVNSAQLQRT